MSPALSRLRWLSRNLEKPVLARAKRPWLHRLRTEPLARLMLRGRQPCAFRSERIGGVPCRVLPGKGNGTLLYIHGGAFILFSARSHQGLAARLAQPFGLRAVLPEYDRAPEAAFPIALDQLTATYEALAQDTSHDIVIAGDSAGGGLALSLLNRILARGMQKPAAVLAFSPWTDLTLSGESIRQNAASDPMLPATAMPMVRDMYLAGHDPRDPEASPVFGAYSGAPHVLVQACADEILRSDSEAVAARITECGASCELQVLPDGLHAFQLFFGWIPEANDAVEASERFLARALAGDPRR